jgi:hypothetical protein
MFAEFFPVAPLSPFCCAKRGCGDIAKKVGFAAREDCAKPTCDPLEFEDTHRFSIQLTKVNR